MEKVMSDKHDIKAGKRASTAPTFEIPTFSLPKFDFPNSEMPAPFRDMATKAAAQAKETIETMERATEEVSRVVESSFANSGLGSAEYNRKLFEVARSNAQAVFGYSLALLKVTTLNEVVELSSAHMQKQFEAMSEQTKELAALAQKAAAAMTESMKTGITKPLNKK
jgi:phasin